MKKLLALLLTFTLTVSFAACTKEQTSSGNDKTVSSNASSDISSGVTDSVPRTMAQLVGSTVKDVKAVFGDGAKLGYYHGAGTAEYEDEKAIFVFTGYYDTLDDDCVIALSVSQGEAKLFENLTGTMTYPELVEAVDRSPTVTEPKKEFDDMFGAYRYFLTFFYKGYHFKYTWNEDPNTNKSVEGQVKLSSKY